MKRMKSLGLLVLTVAGIHTAIAADLLNESFETDGQGVRYTSTQEFIDTASDHWGRTDGSNISNFSGPYSGFDGTTFWAAEDVDDPDGNGLDTQTIYFENINITGHNNLQFLGLFAAGNESGPGASKYDAADVFKVQYRINGDGADPFTDGVCFAYENNGDASNEPIGLDADCDGESDGVAGRLGTSMTEYGFTIASTGFTMDLLVTVSVDAGEEELALDHLRVIGDPTGIDSPPVIISTTPGDSAVNVATSSQILVEFNETVDVAANAVNINCTLSGIQNLPAAPEAGITSLTLNPTDFTSTEDCTVTVNAASVSDVDGSADQLDGDGNGTPGDDFVFSFTLEPDVPPTVTGSYPANGSVGFGVADDLTIDFSESIDATATAATLVCSVSGAVSFSGLPLNDSTVMTLNPDNNLIDTETCDLTIAAAEVTDNDLTADNMESDEVISFTVGFPVVEIFDIQGAGLISPYDNSRVTTLDNIVTVLTPNGFYMQTPDARDDLDFTTSNGIFVYTQNPPTVAVGDQVDLTGDVTEYFGLTEFTNPFSYVLSVDSQGNPLPTAVLLNDSFPPNDPAQLVCPAEGLDYECLEGMWFNMPQGFVSSASIAFFGANRDDQLVRAGTARAFREPGIDYPGQPGLPVFDGNPELLEMDIDTLGLDLATNSHPAGSEISVTGVFGYDFEEYEIWPSQITLINENVIPSAVRDAGDEVTLASANMYRFFDDVDDPGDQDDGQVEDPVDYANRLLKLANYVVNDLKSPIILALQEVENINALNDLIMAISNAGGPAYTAELIEGNDRGGIDVAYLYQTALLSNVTLDQLGETEVIVGFDGALLHDRPPLHLRAEVSLVQGDFTINVLVVHLRSRGGIDDPSEGDRVRGKRLQQANSVAAMIDDIQTNHPGESLYVLGDFNAFQFSDGYVDVIGQITGEAVQAENLVWTPPQFAADPLHQAVQLLSPEQQYSFVFRGSAQVLDNAIMNDAGLMNLIEMQFVRGQADAGLDNEDDNSTSIRSSDHDGFVLFIKEDLDLIFRNGFD
ncbi:Ig-like domain-containing protein [Marinicella sediminis]|uniref:Ig-like domain-containing protein n=1 Tax=Marinicella sediminis TaxID=1792834 RepID=A0ABV7J7C4_9GAMM|nr:Ig-like domain-containing protein [Marinicella sediminis]